jgi:hypothetical protein
VAFKFNPDFRRQFIPVLFKMLLDLASNPLRWLSRESSDELAPRGLIALNH